MGEPTTSKDIDDDSPPNLMIHEEDVSVISFHFRNYQEILTEKNLGRWVPEHTPCP